MSPARENGNNEIYESEVWLPRPRPEVFDFFKKAENLQLITPDWLDFKILTPQPISMQLDTQIDYSLRLFALTFKWQTRITQWQPPVQFVDSQVKGPYRIWEHTHFFEEKEGGTLMRDRVKYLSRGGLLAPLLHAFFVTDKVSKIFDYRKKQILKIFN